MHYKRYALGLLLLCWLVLGLSSAVYAGEPVVKLTNPNGQVFQLEAKIESSDLQAELQKPSGYLRHLDHIFIFLAAAAIIFLSLRYQLLNSKRRKLPITLWDGLAWLLLFVATLLVANAIAELWFSDISTQEGVLEKVGENAGLKNLQDFYLAPITVILGFLAILFVIQIEANRLKNERKHAQLKSQENLRDAAEYATELLKEYDRHQLDFIHDPISVQVNGLDDGKRFDESAAAIAKSYRLEGLHAFVTHYPNYLVVDEDDKPGNYLAYYAHYLLFLYCLGDNGLKSRVKSVVYRSLHSHYLSHVRQLLEPDHNDLAHELQKVQTVIEDLFLRGDFNLNSDENAANRSTMRHFLTFQRISQELSEIRRARVYLKLGASSGNQYNYNINYKLIHKNPVSDINNINQNAFEMPDGLSFSNKVIVHPSSKPVSGSDETGSQTKNTQTSDESSNIVQLPGGLSLSNKVIVHPSSKPVSGSDETGSQTENTQTSDESSNIVQLPGGLSNKVIVHPSSKPVSGSDETGSQTENTQTLKSEPSIYARNTICTQETQDLSTELASHDLSRVKNALNKAFPDIKIDETVSKEEIIQKIIDAYAIIVLNDLGNLEEDTKLPVLFSNASDLIQLSYVNKVVSLWKVDNKKYSNLFANSFELILSHFGINDKDIRVVLESQIESKEISLPVLKQDVWLKRSEFEDALINKVFKLLINQENATILLPYIVENYKSNDEYKDHLKKIVEYYANLDDITQLLSDYGISSIEAAEIRTLMCLVRQMHIDGFAEILLRVMVEIQNEYLKQRYIHNTGIETKDIEQQLASMNDEQLGFNMIFRFTRGVFNRYRYYDLFHTLHHLRVQADKAVKWYERSWLDQLLIGECELGKVIESFELTQATYKKLVAFEEVRYHNSSYLRYQPLIRILLTRETIVLDEGSEPPPGLLYRNDNDDHVKILVSHVKEFIEKKPSDYTYFLFDLLYWIKEVYLDQELFNSLKDNYKIIKEKHPETYKLFEERIKSVFGTKE